MKGSLRHPAIFTSIVLGVIFLILFILPEDANAQCAMCKAVLENQYSDDGIGKSGGINKGILFLMGIPYILIGLAIWYYLKNRPKASHGER